ncbi:carbohydrate ABC transporter permease [Pararobbsia alpina]|uniref:Trehalose transport system permease protein SugA n=1 Tax=Pararobbsia alpina TaxID=621374 RepID=A0A6S7C380_9BURK|nr:sugar ABC transporter permease [Pararobbsia alpina]CAB3800385.1 Trehalose transport system permease protein SugA [Pararobbsia alpina]
MRRAALDAAVGVPARDAARTAPKIRSRAAQMRRTAWFFVAPAALFFLILIAFPLLSVLWRSLQFASLTNPTVAGFAGLENYRTILDDDQFWPALRNTSIWTGVSVAGEYALGLLSAVALAQPIRGRAIFRGVIIIPWVIPIVVAGLDWTWMLTPDYGVINLWLVKLGVLDKPHFWLGDMGTALFTVTFVNIWRSFPFYTISLLAALQAVPPELHEAAAIDGAGPIRRFFAITMPHLKTVSFTLIFIHVIWTAINFDFIWVMTEGGPLNASLTLPIMIYRYAMQDYDIGAACALASMSMGFMATAFFVYYYGVMRRSKGGAR